MRKTVLASIGVAGAVVTLAWWMSAPLTGQAQGATNPDGINHPLRFVIRERRNCRGATADPEFRPLIVEVTERQRIELGGGTAFGHAFHDIAIFRDERVEVGLPGFADNALSDLGGDGGIHRLPKEGQPRG